MKRPQFSSQVKFAASGPDLFLQWVGNYSHCDHDIGGPIVKDVKLAQSKNELALTEINWTLYRLCIKNFHLIPQFFILYYFAVKTIILGHQERI